MTRIEQAAAALHLAGFGSTATALEDGERINVRGLLRMLRWAVRYYQAERAVMAHALRCAKALAKEQGP